MDNGTSALGSALVIGAAGSIGRATAEALGAAGARVLAAGRERDATDAAQVAALLDEADPDLVVVAAGTRPRMAPIGEQDWASFAAAWNVDVRIAYEVGRAALARPLRPGATVVIVSSGAGLGGSPLSGGYAGAKRMQMFLAGYLQGAADARGLGIRFVALVPRQLVAGTPIGEAAASAYGAAAGQSAGEYLAEHYPVPLDPAGVARAVVALATATPHGDDPAPTVLTAGPEGLRPL
ncbi:SDR family oxidoreductase [Streptomyces sp. NPDC020917]|uniref:SDR family oxidoreductase n=1 Tax=Streptomyces sp. NPDC020917 TaxID=3365102 RepID=UPI00378FA3FB